MTIKDYLGVIRQRLLLTAAVIALSTFSAVILAMRQPPQFATNATLQLEVVAAGTEAGNALAKDFDPSDVNSEIAFLTGEQVAKRVIQRLRLDPKTEVKELTEQFTVAPRQNSTTVEITVRAETADFAKKLANAFMQEYILLKKQKARTEIDRQIKRIERTVNGLMPQLQTFEVALAEEDPGSTRYVLIKTRRDIVLEKIARQEETRQKLSDDAALDSGGGEIVNSATNAIPESSSDPLRTGVLGFIIGLPLALGLALLLDSMTDTVRSKEEAEKLVGADVLGMIPMNARKAGPNYVVSREEPYSAGAEAYRTLRINLEAVTRPEERRILVTSPGMGEGKTATTANLGIAFSEAGRSALIVSGDLRRPRLHIAFDVEATPGLSDVLKGEAASTEAVHEVSQNLYLLPSGTPEPRPDRLLHGIDLKGAIDMLAIRRERKQKPRNQENGFKSGNGSGAEAHDDDEPQKPKKIVGVQPQTMLFDSPPVLGAAEVSAIGSAVDGVLITVQMGVTRRQALTRTAEQIRRTGGKIVGVVLIGVRGEKDYTSYQPEVDAREGDSTWSKVVSGAKDS